MHGFYHSLCRIEYDILNNILYVLAVLHLPKPNWGPRALIDKSKIDKDDEAMVKWKQSLLTAGGKDLSDPNDPRTCIIQSLALEVGHPLPFAAYNAKPTTG